VKTSAECRGEPSTVYVNVGNCRFSERNLSPSASNLRLAAVIRAQLRCPALSEATAYMSECWLIGPLAGSVSRADFASSPLKIGMSGFWNSAPEHKSPVLAPQASRPQYSPILVPEHSQPRITKWHNARVSQCHPSSCRAVSGAKRPVQCPQDTSLSVAVSFEENSNEVYRSSECYNDDKPSTAAAAPLPH
jgi:hypothetical protein